MDLPAAMAVLDVIVSDEVGSLLNIRPVRARKEVTEGRYLGMVLQGAMSLEPRPAPERVSIAFIVPTSSFPEGYTVDSDNFDLQKRDSRHLAEV